MLVSLEYYTIINNISYVYYTISLVLWLWIIYLFTVREFLDWHRISKNKKDYDFNSVTRTNKIKNTIQKKNK